MSLDAAEFFEERESHYTKFLGPLTDPVLHSTDLKVPHIDVYQFRPTESRPFWTLITGGMSNYRQPGAPDGIAPRAEILLYASQPENWMFSVLKGLAEMPFDNNTYLHWGHTVPNGMPMTARPSLLTNFFFLPAYLEPVSFLELTIAGDSVEILWMVPITDAELEYKLTHDTSACLRLSLVAVCRKSSMSRENR